MACCAKAMTTGFRTLNGWTATVGTVEIVEIAEESVAATDRHGLLKKTCSVIALLLVTVIG
jgi:hypothetical protein